MYKIIGIFLIISASLLVSFYIKQYGVNQLAFAGEMISFIEYIKNQIDYFLTPLDEIISSYKGEMLNKYDFLTYLDPGDWYAALNMSRGGKMLDNETRKDLELFSLKLGKSAKDEQIKNCDYAIESLQKFVLYLKDEKQKKLKAYSALAIMTGFLIALFLI